MAQSSARTAERYSKICPAQAITTPILTGDKKMNIQELKQQSVREVIRQYVADDGLKPSADGMTAYEIAGIILREADKVEKEMTINDIFKGIDDHDCKAGQDSGCLDPIHDNQPEEENADSEELVMNQNL